MMSFFFCLNMERTYTVTFIAGKVTRRKIYKTERNAYKAMRKWLLDHGSGNYVQVSLFGTDNGLLTFTDHNELPVAK